MKKLREKKYERIIVAWCYLSYYYKHTFIPKTNPQKKSETNKFPYFQDVFVIVGSRVLCIALL